jgi:glycosyltransferase involved in cell wall biosynthesis
VASVDVAIPCYQYGHFLRDCVDSVLGQDIQDLRLLIIDNASTDDSVEIARELAARDPRIEVIARPVNLGAQASFNEAVDWARADYFTVLCADDRMAPGALKRAVAVMEEHPSVSFAYGRGVELRPSEAPAALPDEPADGQHDWTIIDGPDFIARRCHTGANHIATCTVLVRTRCQKQAGHYREGLPYTDDLEMWMRLATLGPVAETSATKGIWLVHGANMSAFYQARQTRDLLAIKDAFDSFFRHEGSQLPNARALHRQAVRSIGERSDWSALSHLSRGHGSTGLALFKLAVRLRPSTAIVPPVNYLFRMDDPFGRVKQVVSEIAGNLASLRPAKHG